MSSPCVGNNVRTTLVGILEGFLKVGASVLILIGYLTGSTWSAYGDSAYVVGREVSVRVVGARVVGALVVGARVTGASVFLVGL